MKRARDPVHRFLDLEAAVGDNDEEDEEGEEDNDGGFIEDEPVINPHYIPQRQVDKSSDRDGGWHDLVASLGERYASGSRTIRHIVEDNCSNERPLDPALVSCIKNITHLPTHDDYPFWRVRCKPGSAEATMLFLRQMAAPCHEMLSAFVHGSIRCWVYLQATMNDHLRQLLKLAPGIIRGNSGFIFEHVDPSDGLRLLKMQHARPVEVGEWVQVRKGIYKGDVGYVSSTESTGRGVQLLLIPRLSQPQASKGNLLHSRSAPALFDCETVKRLYDVEPACIQENTYSFRGDRFEHGLIIKSYHSDLISTTISCMPFELFCLFLDSCHPTIVASQSSFLKPSEWHFAESDEVYIVDDSYPPCYKTGVISMLRSDTVEVSTEEGIVCVPWLKIRKVICQGDFVEVTGGIYLGQTGWVGGLQEQKGSKGDAYFKVQVANIIKIEDEEKPLSERTQIFDVSVNLLKRTTVPHVLGTHLQGEGAIGRSERVPWLNKEIVVVKDGHVFRTLKGIVKDVLCNQPTPSGLRLVVQMNSIMAFPSITLDYDGVVEASCGIKLHDYAPPQCELFIPRNKTWEPAASSHALIQPPPVYSHSPGNATPIPESPYPSSPAWDPSSRTPKPNPDHSLAGRSSSPSLDRFSLSSQHHDNPHSLPSPSTSTDPLDEGHILLDSRLLNVQLRVVVTGGTFNRKELTASVHCIDGQLSIQRHFYKSEKALLPKWVTPKFPNPTRDNGLLIVIKGEHCGKYVRRIHHCYVDDQAIVILSVVKRVAGHVDTLTGERLELDVSYLCVSEESKEDKMQNRLLMNELREEARKIRAK